MSDKVRLIEWPVKTNSMSQLMYKVSEAERMGLDRQGSFDMFYWAAIYNYYKRHLRGIRDSLTLWGDTE